MQNDVPPIADVYENISKVVHQTTRELLKPFRLAGATLLSDPTGFQENEFFSNFFDYANSFTDKLCDTLAKLFRTATILPEVRATPTIKLARQIRTDVFLRPDSVLAEYSHVMTHLGIKLNSTSSIGGALTGAVMGRVLGGDSGALLGASLGLLSEATAQAQIKTAARVAAFIAIRTFLAEIEATPETLIDYSAALILGPNVDFTLQANALERLRPIVTSHARACDNLIVSISPVKAEYNELTAMSLRNLFRTANELGTPRQDELRRILTTLMSMEFRGVHTLLPQRIACPECGTELELDPSEQERKMFTCSECNTDIDFT